MLRKLLAKSNKRILLNLADVSFIDSAGPGELVRALTSIRSEGGDLKLLNVPKRFATCCRSLSCTRVFDLKEDESGAIAAFVGPQMPTVPQL
jgi:anti-sigma B factor antagonist